MTPPLSQRDGRRERLLALAVLLGATLLHLVLAAALPLSGDEAYYWDCSRHLDWSYFDQPPLVPWAMIPFRALLGEHSLAVRSPALLASLAIGLFLYPLVRRLGGTVAQASAAYVLLHAMPLFFIGAFYTSTDIAMAAAYVAATWAVVAIAQGEQRAWFGLGLAVGLGFLAKFPVVLVLPALAAAGWRVLRSARAYLAGAVALALSTPVWLWALEHDFDNVAFQLAGRHHAGGFTLRFLAELVGGNLLLATPFLAPAFAVAWWRRWRTADPGWRAFLLATAAPVVFFALVALRTRVGIHWTAPALVLAPVAVVLTPFRGRRALVVLGCVAGLLLSVTVVAAALFPERLLAVQWSYAGRPHRISTDKVAAAVGNRELLEEVERRRGSDAVASESYTTTHLLAFLSGGRLPTLLAHVKPGKHGLASLYWYRPEELRGRDVLFVTEKRQVDERLRSVFGQVEEEAPLEIRRQGAVVRTVRFLRCRALEHPESVFTRLE